MKKLKNWRKYQPLVKDTSIVAVVIIHRAAADSQKDGHGVGLSGPSEPIRSNSRGHGFNSISEVCPGTFSITSRTSGTLEQIPNIEIPFEGVVQTMVVSLLPGISMLVSRRKQSVEHLVDRATVGLSSAPGEFSLGMGVEAIVRAVGVGLEVGAAVGSVGEVVGAMYAGEVDDAAACSLQAENRTEQLSMTSGGVVVVEENYGAPIMMCDATTCLLQAVGVTTHSSMAPGVVAAMGVGAAVNAGVDGGVATAGAAVGVEGAGEVGEDEGADDRVADARVLRVLHIPAFTSSIIRSMRSIFASSSAMVATDSVDPGRAILPRSMALVPNVTILEVTTGVHARRGEIGGAVSGEERRRGEK
ncbi:unnamed protein product [Miscanthus lutarioriparius]|uniref:Uncharacterized protein n=1 Tax=Miscanthus lutarioriparius TaxID=422564 RepID=A0A811P6X6_9POAL|nr:unnamed protein product [Miscanthus lutarioriparius]